jgi:hypothetical protein
MSQAPPPASAAAGYPVSLAVASPPEIKRWLPFVAWLLALPHYFVFAGVAIVGLVCELIALFTILFTKRIPDGVVRFLVLTNRYGWRLTSYVLFLRNEYPPFEFDGADQNPGTDAAAYSVTRPAEYNRWLPLVKWLLAFPHYIILGVLGIAVQVCALIAAFIVLFTGRWPEGLREFVVGVYRWQYRVNSYVYLLIDDYPPFSLD